MQVTRGASAPAAPPRVGRLRREPPGPALGRSVPDAEVRGRARRDDRARSSATPEGWRVRRARRIASTSASRRI